MSTGEQPPFAQVAIVGCGLIGGSIALGARARWPGCRLVGVDRPGVLAAAVAGGIIDEAGTDLAAIAGSHLIVLAAPVRASIDALHRLAPHVTPAAVVTDVSGTKRAIAEAAAAHAGLTFIGGHPLAGAARGGLDRAHGALFKGRPWIFTPPAGMPDAPLARLERFVEGLGALPRRMTADAHDRLLAYLSHLPQLAVSALMAVVGDETGPEGLALAGPGLRDTTRLAASPPDIWRDVVGTNADHVAAAIDALIATLEQLRPRGADGREIDATFAGAARWREVLDG